MKSKSFFYGILVLVFAVVLVTSCKDNKRENNSKSHTELHASATFQCPMDCEDGKTYEKEGKCPVCKMDLKASNQGDAMTCAQHKDGKCTCEGDTCKCANCPDHSTTKTCKMHKDGKCSCEGDSCKCDNCPEHGKAMTCSQHKDGKCSCEGDACKCANCPTHS